ncbi:MAG TPA: Lrp/AsnC family transcriptional regulator [Azospirillaceae bacterium]|nr:Lrp/AsnC family transcriptional regulator [Azospirillaceae bacterium]
MDTLDHRIIALLQQDGRLSHAELGSRVGLSVSAVNERVRKLHAAGAIRGWAALADPAALGLGVLAFVGVTIERPEHNAGFLAAVVAWPEVQECHHVTGAWSYLLKVRTPSLADLDRLLGQRIKALPGVIGSHTLVVLSSSKETPALPVPGVTPE